MDTVYEAMKKQRLKVLKKGSKGRAVESLQVYLSGMGYEIGDDLGEFGESTARAARLYNQTFGINAEEIRRNT